MSRRNVQADRHSSGLALAQGLIFGSHIEHRVETNSGQVASFITPNNIVVRCGDQLRFITDGRGRLRALENVSLATGWKLPTRAMGQRSPLAYLGWLLIVPAAVGLLFAAPFFFALQSADRSLQALAGLTGDPSNGDLEPAVNEAVGTTGGYMLYALAILVAGGALLLLRSKPSLNAAVPLTDELKGSSPSAETDPRLTGS